MYPDQTKSPFHKKEVFYNNRPANYSDPLNTLAPVGPGLPPAGSTVMPKAL
jgi:hypothetical protein